mgnify:CR=1 FL=1
MGILRDIGAPGLIIIVLGALLIFGPKRLPELGESVGKMLSEFKKAVKGMLPKNKLAADRLARLRVFAGPEHAHTAQTPKEIK